MSSPHDKWVDRLLVRLRLHEAILWMANSLKVIVAAYLISLLLGSLAFALSEHKSFGLSLWWSDVTALTIGYGDVAPVTPIGRILAAIFQHFWVYCIGPLVVVNLAVRVLHNDDQFTNKEQQWIVAALQAIAAAHGIKLPPRPNDTDHGDVTEDA